MEWIFNPIVGYCLAAIVFVVVLTLLLRRLKRPKDISSRRGEQTSPLSLPPLPGRPSTIPQAHVDPKSAERSLPKATARIPLSANSYCPNCGSPIQPSDTFCDNCGHALTPPPRIPFGKANPPNLPGSANPPSSTYLPSALPTCPNCGAGVRPNTKFCVMCGNNLAQPLPTFISSPKEELPELPFAIMASRPLVTSLRLDANVPEMVVLKVPFDLAVAVRQMSSPALREEGLTLTRSSEVQVEWPVEAPAVDLRIHVHAPGCHIADQPFQYFRLRAGQDSPEVYFSLTPLRLGNIPIRVTLYQAFLALGSARLTIFAGEQEAGHVMTSVVSDVRPVTQGDGALGIYSLIMHAFSLDEVVILCGALGIDYDDLTGTTRQRKVSELVNYCRRRGLAEALVAHVLAARPNWMDVMAWQWDYRFIS